MIIDNDSVLYGGMISSREYGGEFSQKIIKYMSTKK